MFNFNSVSLSGSSLLILTMGLYQLGIIPNGYLLLFCIFLSVMVIFIPMVKDLRDETRKGHETRNNVEQKS